MSHECWDIYGGFCACGKSVTPKPVELDEITVDERVGRALMDANAALDRVRALCDEAVLRYSGTLDAGDVRRVIGGAA